MIDLREIYLKTVSDITKDGDRWVHFLNTAAHLYKYSFINQVYIYAQKPDATACATYETWLKLNCLRKNNAKAIGIFDNTYIQVVY